MNAAVLIASRELRDRTRLFIIAAAMAVIPFASALAVRQNRQMAIVMVATVLAAAYTGALAVALGVSTVGRELTEKRLSFFFSKPVSAASIWIGKAMAGLLTLAGAFAIIVLPAYLFAHDGWRDNWAAGGSAITAYTLIMSTVLFFGSHAASTMFRSRSALVAVDFVLFAMMLIAVFAITRPILMGGGLDVVLKMLLAIGISSMVLLVAAPIWQLSRGRIEPRRNHAAFSTMLWSGVAVVLIVVAGYAFWVISPPLASLNSFYSVAQSPSGNWFSVSGQAPNRGSYLASFLVDTNTGERERMAVTPWGSVHVSDDGKTAVWMESDEFFPRTGRLRVHTRRLEPGARQTATQLVLPNAWRAALTDDASRLAISIADRIEVYEVSSGRLLAVTRGVTHSNVRSMFFAGPNVVRMFEVSRGPDPTMRMREFDISSRKLTTSAARPAPRTVAVNVTRDGSRLFIRQDAEIVDARTGSVLTTLPVKPEKPFSAAMLPDGSTIVTRDAKLHHFDANGAAVAEIAIPVKQAVVVGQLGASKILLSSSGQNAKGQMLVVDLAARKVELAMPGLRSPLAWWHDSTLQQFTEDATIVAMDGERKLLLVDGRTGAKRSFPS